MAATKLGLYNAAQLLCRERETTLTESVESRRLLDSVYDRGNGAIRHCLEQGLWNFAMRTVQIDYDTAAVPAFGLRRSFDKPADWVKTAGVWSDEYLRAPLLDYRDEQAYWYADIDVIYVSYVSDDASYGSDFSLWPENFTRYVEAYLANEIIGKLTHAQTDPEEVKKTMKDRLNIAKSSDALGEATRFFPSGSWVNARGGRGSRDRGSRSNLIG